MKTIKLLAATLMLVLSCAVQAQINIKVNINPPDWGPAEATNVKFYFLPDIQVYYDVPNKVFIYRSGTVWVRTATLPARYGTFNLYTGYKVMLNDGDRPYEHFDEHCRHYPKGYGHGKHQKTWKEEGHHDNGNHYGERKHDHDEDGDHDHGHGHGHGHDHGHGHGHDDDDD